MAIVHLKSIKELFGEIFFVPSYQRGYRWTRVQFKDLIEDLYYFSVKNKSITEEEKKDYYCLQPIIVKKREDSWELVDGQQRLTALWLIMASYYCTQKINIPNFSPENHPREEYHLEYENKPIFTELFNEIGHFVENKQFNEFNNYFDKKKDDCIDSRYLIDSMNFFINFNIGTDYMFGISAAIYSAIEYIKIIWYELEEDDDSIQTFTNINANRIELTNAELIKAVLLQSNKDQHLDLAFQWEEIEKGINNSSFWYFFVDEQSDKYTTRIDYLFEIWCENNGFDIDKDDHYSVFHIINEVINKKIKGYNVKRLWEEIQNIYEILQDWCSDYDYYHMIGLLIILSKDEKETIKTLFDYYLKLDKTRFRGEIIGLIKKYYFSASTKLPFNSFTLKDIADDIADLSYQDTQNAKNVLLLYNISMLINAHNTYEKFPFDLYKKEKWDIEHVNPQTPEESNADRIEWLKSYRVFLESHRNMFSAKDPTLLSDIDECIKDPSLKFNDVSARINLIIGIKDLNEIGNLVLLDSNTNRSYKNACFFGKRKTIIDIERTCGKGIDDKTSTKYIPIGTKWVFLKGYENSDSLVVWNNKDMEEYTQDMAKNIYIMLGGK